MTLNHDQLDQTFMREALIEADKAYQEGEVPIGAVAVCEGLIIARGYNRRRALRDITAHAEIMLLRDLSSKLQGLDLSGITIYSTLEPCAMCAGAMLHYGVHRIVYGAQDLKLGAIKSRFHVFDGTSIESTGGILENDCIALLLTFFEHELGRPSNTWEDITVLGTPAF